MTTAGGGGGGGQKKKQRIGINTRLSSTSAIINETLPESSSTSSPSTSSIPTISGGFNDSTTADTILRLYIETTDQSDLQIYLHSNTLRRSKYFNALLSERWQHIPQADQTDENDVLLYNRLNLDVSASPDSINNHLIVLQLLYTYDFTSVINNVATALSLLPVALHLLFEECVTACVKFLEAVPWTEEEERRIISLVPLLGNEEAKELLVRVSPMKRDSSEEMLYGLIVVAIHNNPNMAFAKAFVAKLLREFSSREGAGRVLDRAFERSLKLVRESLEEYSSPDFRGDHNETEAIQRLNLHTALTNGKHLLWLVERMIELRVADKAVKDWSEQASFTMDLQRAFRDDAWKNIVPGLPVVLLKCTSRLSEAIATGSILAPRVVRMKLVKAWLPVLVVCKDSASHITSHKLLYLDLEKTFLEIISTLPLSDAHELLQQCLGFSTRNVEDCDHLVGAFTTWFRRANGFFQDENMFK